MILEQIAKKKNITKTQMARDLDISESMVTLLFQGKRNPSMRLVKKIKDTYNLSWNKVMGDV